MMHYSQGQIFWSLHQIIGPISVLIKSVGAENKSLHWITVVDYEYSDKKGCVITYNQYSNQYKAPCSKIAFVSAYNCRIRVAFQLFQVSGPTLRTSQTVRTVNRFNLLTL